MKNILLAGGAGYIGSVLTEILLTEGYKVKVLDRFFFGRDFFSKFDNQENLTLIKADTRDFDAEVLKDVDCVVDLSGISNDPSCDLNPEITQDINLNGTLNLAGHAKKAGVKRYIFSSSCSVYGSSGNDIIDESSDLAPVSLYAESKIKAEKALMELSSDDFCVTFMRNATVYGLSYRMRFDLVINIMTLYAFEKQRIFIMGGGEQWRPLVHVRDVCKAIKIFLKAPAAKINGQFFNIGSNEQNYRVKTIAYLIKKVFPHIQIERAPSDPDKRSYNVCFDKIKNELGFVPDHNPEDTIKEIYEALVQERTSNTVKTSTLKFYKYLIEAEKILSDVSLNGRIF